MNILINLDRRIEGLFRRIATNTSAEDLSFYRVFVCLFFLITTKNLSFLSEIPNGLLRPNILSLSNLLDSWPNSFFFHLLFGIRILTCITSILGIRARMSLLILGMCIIIEHNFYNSFGKIDHTILIDLIPFILAFTNCGTRFAILPDKEKKTQDYALAIMGIFIVFSFFTAGISKLFNWVDFDLSTSGFLNWFYAGFYSSGRNELLANLVFLMPNWMLEVMDYCAVFFEVFAFLFLIYSRSSWTIFLLIAGVFHIMNTLLLNIPFSTNLFVFGVWILSPLLQKYKILFILPFIFLLDISGAKTGLIVWTIFIAFGFFGLYSSLRKNKKNFY